MSLRERLWMLRERLSSRSEGASSSLFTGIRRRLTLQYLGVLAALLLIGGSLLYFGVRHALLDPVEGDLRANAQHVTFEMHEHPDVPCPTFASSDVPSVPYAVCYYFQTAPADSTQQIVVVFGSGQQPPPAAFASSTVASSSLASAALASSSGFASDIVFDTNGLGAIQRYALVVHDPSYSGPVRRVIQVGIPIQGSLDALNTLAISLLLVGLLTLGGAAGASIWLSGRAMAPAHIAFERQQSFIADAAHELRTPLTLMRADAEVMLRGRERLAPDDAELLEDIVAETAHMSALATNLLTLARLDAGALHIERDVIDLGEVAANVVRRVHALADEKGATLNAVAQDKVTVVGDRALLEQAALILVDNAVKYNRPEGTVTVSVSGSGDMARLEVRDTGIGIPAESLPRLGERFYRVDKARSREQGGAGLGLSIARGIAAAHNGSLTLASAPGVGTTATLNLPVAG